MLAQADHNNMASLSNRRCISSDLRSANFKKFPGDHAPGPPKNCLAPPAQETQDNFAFGAISSKHLRLWKLYDLGALQAG